MKKVRVNMIHMKKLDKFMRFVLFCQKKLCLLAEVWKKHNGMVLLILFIQMATGIIFVLRGKTFWANSFLILFSITSYLKCLIKVNSSARKFLYLIIFYNLIFILPVVVTSFSNINTLNIDAIVFKIVVSIYFVFWIFSSLVIKIDTARITNEVISGLLTVLFTAGTFVSSLITPKYSFDEFIDIIENSSTYPSHPSVLSGEFSHYGMIELYKFILPFLCITILSLVSISVKEYWLKKNGLKEVWDEELTMNEQMVTLNHRIEEFAKDIRDMKQENIRLNEIIEELHQKDNV